MKRPRTPRVPPRLAELEPEYEILREIGRDATTVVYLARDRELGREVGIKALRELYEEGGRASARLAREARMLSDLQHPNVEVLYGVRRLSDGSVALLLQHVPGRSLASEIRARGPLPFELVTRVLSEIGHALAHLHGRGIVHLDVRPETIHLDDEAFVARLRNLGFARPLSGDPGPPPPTGLAGGAARVPPERLEGGAPDPRADVYGLGLVGYAMLAGRAPWSGEVPAAGTRRREQAPVRPLRQLRPDVPEGLRLAIEGALQRPPEERWSDAGAFLAAMGIAPVARPSAPPPDRRGAEVPRGSGAAGPDGAAAPPERPARPFSDVLPSARRPARIAAAVAASLAIVGTASAVSITLRGQPSLPPIEDEAGALAGAALAAGETAGPPSAARAVRGDGQEGPVGDPLTDWLVLAVEDARGRPVEGVWVRFAVAEGEADVDPDSVATNQFGMAGASLLPLAPGAHTVRAVVSGRGDSVAATFRVTAVGPALVADDAESGAVDAPEEALPVAESGEDEAASAPSRPRLPVRGGLAAGGTHTCSLGGDGVAVCWGANESGQLGGTAGRRAEAIRVVTREPLAAVSAGVAHTCALAVSGDALCWGANAAGQLGDGTRRARSAPERVALDEPLVHVAAGSSHSCGVAASGRMYCWGENARGQLGDGTTVDRATPALVAGGRTFRAVAVGWAHTCGLTAEGTAYCWGRNRSGELGDGGGSDRSRPSLVAGASRFRALAAGGEHTCGLSADGRVLCWGANAYGQLGTGRGGDSAVPVSVASTERFSAVVAGAVHGCALTTSGEALCWGRNTYGQLGDGTTADRPAPALVFGRRRFATLHASGAHTCGTAAGGGRFCWGYNVQGQLGSGGRDNETRPVPVAQSRGTP